MTVATTPGAPSVQIEPKSPLEKVAGISPAILTEIRSHIARELASLTALRRDLHAHPELAFAEHRTSQVVQKELAALGIAFKAGLAKTGVVGYLPSTTGNDASSVGLRADMDALPIEEATGKPYSSTCPGVMHACGHDGHTTMLIGAARVLKALSHRPNAVSFVFQPAEENGGGGHVMCQEGVLKGQHGGGIGAPIRCMFGQHGWPAIKLGTVWTTPGPVLANTDDFYITIKGIQAHGAYPHLGRDTIVCGSAIVTALQTIASRNVAPLESVVVTVGQFHAGTATNIIPQTAKLIGTVRTLSAAIKAIAKERLFALVEHTAKAHGCEAEINWVDGYPATINDDALTELFFNLASSAIGNDRVGLLPEPSMGGEDFAFYGQEVPACFFMLGLKPAGIDRPPALHQPDFDFNDEALALGIEMLVVAAVGAE